MKKLTILLLLLTVSFMACEKDEEVSKTDLLTKSNWYDVAPEETCYEDDYLKFNGDKTFKVVEGDPCAFSIGDFTGAWFFANNETQLVLSIFGLDTSTINTLTETTLKYTDSDGDSYEFKH